MGIDSASIAADVQLLAPGNLIELFELDATDFGATQVYYFTENTDDGNSVVFNGVTYEPLDFQSDGFQWTSSGQLPEPTIKLANTNNAIGAAVNDLGDLVGAKLTRRRTFEKYLDGRPGADPTAQFPIDIFVIEQKTAHNKLFVEFKLVPFYDYTGVRIPRRLILRDSCPYIYRSYDSDTGDFNYDYVVGCPYTYETGDPEFVNYFDTAGDTCVKADDDCGKRLSDCKLRHALVEFTTGIPFGGFPNVAKIRIR